MAPMFEYEVRSENGQKIEGTLEAENESMLAQNLRKINDEVDFRYRDEL